MVLSQRTYVFKQQRNILDMKKNKEKWVGPCKNAFVSSEGFIKLLYEVNRKFIKFDCKHLQISQEIILKKNMILS